jgi:hypothetical protein
MRQRLRNLVRDRQISRAELDENTATLIDAVLQSLVFCLSLLALVTCLARLPPLPGPAAHPPVAGQGWPEGQGLGLGISG